MRCVSELGSMAFAESTTEQFPDWLLFLDLHLCAAHQDAATTSTCCRRVLSLNTILRDETKEPCPKLTALIENVGI